MQKRSVLVKRAVKCTAMLLAVAMFHNVVFATTDPFSDQPIVQAAEGDASHENVTTGTQQTPRSSNTATNNDVFLKTSTTTAAAFAITPYANTPIGTYLFEGENIFEPILDGGENGNHTHGSTIVVLPTGELLAAWFQGNGERDATTTAIWAARKPVGASVWGTPFIIADTPGIADINPALYVDNEENLWLFWYPVLGAKWSTSQPKYKVASKGNYETSSGVTGAPLWKWQDAIYVRLGGSFGQQADTFYDWAYNQGDTSEYVNKTNDPYVDNVLRPKYQEYRTYGFASVGGGNDTTVSTDGAGTNTLLYSSAFNNFVNQTIEVAYGTIFGKQNINSNSNFNVPYARRLGWQTKDKPIEITYNGKNRLMLPLYSDTLNCTIMAITEDGGKSWVTSSPIIGVANIQGSVLQRNDGTLVCYMRDNGVVPKRVVTSTSTDGGMNWTIGYDHQGLFDPGVGHDLAKLPNGNWVFVHNSNQHDGRFALAVAISEDEGATWTYRRHIVLDTRTNRGSYHYPAVVTDASGNIHITYSTDYSADDGALVSHNNIRYIKVTEDWVKQGDPDLLVYAYDIIQPITMVQAASLPGLTSASAIKTAIESQLPATIKAYYSYNGATDDKMYKAYRYVLLPIKWDYDAILAKLGTPKAVNLLDLRMDVDFDNLPSGITVDMLPSGGFSLQLGIVGN